MKGGGENHERTSRSGNTPNAITFAFARVLLACSVCVFIIFSLSGCAKLAHQFKNENRTADFEWVGSRQQERASAPGPLRLRWVRDLGDPTVSYVPWQYAAVAADPAHNRLYVGARKRSFWILNGAGGLLAEPLVRAGVQSQPALDAGKREVYFGSEDGTAYAMNADTGAVLWKASIGNTIRQAPVLLEDSVVFVSETDIVVAFKRKDGTIKWRYQREMPGGMIIEGHAGMLLAKGMIVTAFTDGVVLALDARNGTVKWELDTSQDVEEPPQGIPRFIDVDSTPVLVEDGVYVASVSAGMYYIGLDDGSVRWRNSLYTGATGISSHMFNGTKYLFVSSADMGLLCLRESDRSVVWRKSVTRGSPTVAAALGNVVMIGESDGAFLALRLKDGGEIGRVESATGFSAKPVIAGRRAFVVSNGGTVFSFELENPHRATPTRSPLEPNPF